VSSGPCATCLGALDVDTEEGGEGGGPSSSLSSPLVQRVKALLEERGYELRGEAASLALSMPHCLLLRDRGCM
jgi:hypothetical protein